MTTIRTAVLLVAGTGSRLLPLTSKIPKALLQVGNESILQRLIRQLTDCGIERFVLATGYCEDALRAAIALLAVPVEYCRNGDFISTQNAVSLGCCAGAVRNEPFIKLDSDLVLDAEILDRLLGDSSPMVVAVDRSRVLDHEAMKAVIDADGLVQDFGKSIPIEMAHAESIGIEILDSQSGQTVFSRIETLVASGVRDRYYEDVYAELIRESKLAGKAIDIAGLKWTEVDTLEDLTRARQWVD